MKRRKWAVYYRSREYAYVMGDPCLGYVWAATKEQAERVAEKGGMGGMVGCWCVYVPDKEKTGESLAGSSPVGAAVGSKGGQS